MSHPQNKALFLDRDGTLIVDKNYLSDPAGVELLPGVRNALIQALSSGYRLFIFSNQSGIGRGWYTMQEVDACNQRMFDLLDLPGTGFTEVCIAPESPEEDSPGGYRKPSPRFILEMVEKYDLDPGKCYMVGDRESDFRSGLDAGIRSIALGEEWGEKVKKGAAPEDLMELPRFNELGDAVEWIVEEEDRI